MVLGAPNGLDGTLSDQSKSRLDYCKSVFKPGNRIICTGGWGPQFNTARHSHAYYTRQYLLEKGFLKRDFLRLALSKHTVDDAVKTLAILKAVEASKVTVITSDYHLERVQLIFQEILKDYDLKCIGVKSTLDKKAFDRLIQHEKKSVAGIKKRGLYY